VVTCWGVGLCGTILMVLKEKLKDVKNTLNVCNKVVYVEMEVRMKGLV